MGCRGAAVRSVCKYRQKHTTLKLLEPVLWDSSPNLEGRGRFLPLKAGGLFAKPKPVEFDVALFAFHGLYGEDGRMQGLFEIANVPYTGMRPLASSVLMDKAATKRVLAGTGILLLPYAIVDRPQSGLLPSAQDVQACMGAIDFPVIVKPLHLGSSIGVARAGSMEELRGGLSVIFRLDTHAIIEPLVQNLVEYNVAVRNTPRGIETSAIERPKSERELLDFKAKYLAGGGGGSKSGSKQGGGAISEGMLSLTRELNPPVDSAIATKIHEWSKTCFATVYGTGAPRIDYLCDSQTGEIWLNEVNPCPGSFGYFLWQASHQPMLFPELLSALIDEAFACQRSLQLPPDPTHPDARLFPRG
jgi:D-alanine-D-alanine ligase